MYSRHINNIIIPYIFFLCESNKTIWMFYGRFADEGSNRLSPGLQQGVARSTTPDKCDENRFIPVRFRKCILYAGNYFVVF